jgi:hypothetical protein
VIAKDHRTGQNRDAAVIGEISDDDETDDDIPVPGNTECPYWLGVPTARSISAA